MKPLEELQEKDLERHKKGMAVISEKLGQEAEMLSSPRGSSIRAGRATSLRSMRLRAGNARRARRRMRGSPLSVRRRVPRIRMPSWHSSPSARWKGRDSGGGTIGSIAGGGSTESTLDLQAKIKALWQQEQRLQQKVDDLLQERDSSTKPQEVQLYEAQIQQLEAQQAKAAQARQSTTR